MLEDDADLVTGVSKIFLIVGFTREQKGHWKSELCDGDRCVRVTLDRVTRLNVDFVNLVVLLAL